MQTESVDLRKGIVLGVIAGIIWGCLAMATNALSGVFTWESSLFHNLISFAVGGAVFGIVVSGFLSLLQERLPFKNTILKATFLSVGLWIVVRIGGSVLSSIEPDRYHLVTVQSVQGLALATLMGFILGILWKINSKRI